MCPFNKFKSLHFVSYIFILIIIICTFFGDIEHHQKRSGSVLKSDRREAPCSSRACRPSRSEFSMLFSETRVNTG